MREQFAFKVCVSDFDKNKTKQKEVSERRCITHRWQLQLVSNKCFLRAHYAPGVAGDAGSNQTLPHTRSSKTHIHMHIVQYVHTVSNEPVVHLVLVFYCLTIETWSEMQNVQLRLRKLRDVKLVWHFRFHQLAKMSPVSLVNDYFHHTQDIRCLLFMWVHTKPGDHQIVIIKQLLFECCVGSRVFMHNST